MSDAEGLLWRLEKDPFLSSNVANISIVDRPVDVARLVRRLERATQLVPRLRQRVQPAPLTFTPPSWVDDPGFHIGFHVRHIALPSPGDMRQLLDLAVLFAADPFERSRPLWEFLVVDGLEGGRAAIIQRFHHTLVDGEAGVRLMAHFVDLERDAPEPPPLRAVDLPEPDPEPVPATPGEALREMLTGSLRFPLGALRQASELMADPSRIPARPERPAWTAA